MKRLKLKSEFSRNVLTLMTGTTIAQAIPIAISPILTRIYTPEDFGIFALFMSIVAILALISTCSYEFAIMLPKKEEEAINIFLLSIFITLMIAILSFVIILIFKENIAVLLGNKEIENWLFLTPIAVLFSGLYQSLNYWTNRKKQYKRLATNRVIQSSTAAASNLTLGFSGFGAGGLISSTIFGQGIATLILSKKIWNEDKNIFKKVKKIKIFALAKRYKKMPIYNMPNALIDGFRLSGITILIAKFFSTASLGQFSLAWRMLQVPIGIIGSSLSQVFFQKVSTIKKTEILSITKKFIIKSSIISAPIFLFIYFFAEDIFGFVFGKEWIISGQIASILSPWLFLNFITSPLSMVFITINKQDIMLIFAVFYMIIPLGIIYFFKSYSFLEVLVMLSFSMTAMLILFIILLILSIKQYERK